MHERFNIEQAAPAAFKAMLALTTSVPESGLTTLQRELIKVRASQLNGCAYCIAMHTAAALKAGESAQRLFLLNAWCETDRFTPAEKALLRLTEELTLIGITGVNDETYADVARHFGAAEVPLVVVIVATINAWNRILVASRIAFPG